MKTFLNSFWNFVFCLKFHLQQFSPQWKFQKFPFPPSFSPTLDFEQFQFPPDFVDFKNLFPRGEGSRYGYEGDLVIFC